VLRLLDEGSAERVLIHCFSGDAEIARECVARGYWLSFAGNITYPKNEHLRHAAAQVAADKIVAETDAPFLSPQRLRGSDNEPANVIATLEAVALARGTTFDDAVAMTTSNARALFPGLR
jgi:TatD DNase family protein